MFLLFQGVLSGSISFPGCIISWIPETPGIAAAVETMLAQKPLEVSEESPIGRPQGMKRIPLHATSMAPENGWLEYYIVFFLVGPIFRGYVSSTGSNDHTSCM